MLWNFVARHFGERAAAWCAALFVFAPGSVQKLSLLGLGIHFEAGLFLLLVLDHGLRVWRERADARALFALGLVSGLGISYSYQSVLVVGFVGLVLLLTRPRVVLSRLGAFGCAGTLVGLLPFLWMYASVGSAIFDIHGASLGTGSEAERGIVERLSPFFRSVFVDGAGGGRSFAIAFVATCLLAAASCCFARDRRQAEAARWVAGFGMFWFAVYSASDFVVGAVYHHFLWMRFAPLWFCVAVLMGVWASAGRGRLLIGLVLFSGLIDSGRALSEGTPAAPVRGYEVLASTRGYDYEGYFAKLIGHVDGEGAARLGPLLAFEESEGDWLRADLASAALHEARKEGRVDSLATELAALDPEGAAGFALGLGAWSWERGGGSFDGLLAFVAAYPEPIASALLAGAGPRGSRQLLPAPTPCRRAERIAGRRAARALPGRRRLPGLPPSGRRSLRRGTHRDEARTRARRSRGSTRRSGRSPPPRLRCGPARARHALDGDGAPTARARTREWRHRPQRVHGTR